MVEPESKYSRKSTNQAYSLPTDHLYEYISAQLVRAHGLFFNNRACKFQNGRHPNTSIKLVVAPLALMAIGSPHQGLYLAIAGTLGNTFSLYLPRSMLNILSVIPPTMVVLLKTDLNLVVITALVTCALYSLTCPDADDLLEFTIQYQQYKLFRMMLAHNYKKQRMDLNYFIPRLNQRLIEQADMKLIKIFYDILKLHNLPVVWSFKKNNQKAQSKDEVFLIRAIEMSISMKLASGFLHTEYRRRQPVGMLFFDNRLVGQSYVIDRIPIMVELVRYGSSDILERVIPQLASLLEEPTAFGMTALLESARLNHLVSFIDLKNAGANLEHRTLRGDTALHLAAYSDAVEIIDYCKIYGYATKLNQPRLDGTLPIFIALKAKHLKAALSLAQLGLPFDIGIIRPTIEMIFKTNQIEVLRELYPDNLPARLNACHEHLWHTALTEGHLELVDYLLDKVDSAFLFEPHNNTLFEASALGHQKPVSKVLEKHGYRYQEDLQASTIANRIIWLIKSLLTAFQIGVDHTLIERVFAKLQGTRGRYDVRAFEFQALPGECLNLNFQCDVKLFSISMPYASIYAWILETSLHPEFDVSTLNAEHLMHQSDVVKSLKLSHDKRKFKNKLLDLKQSLFAVSPDFDHAVSKQAHMLKILDKYQLYEQCRKLLRESDNILAELVVQDDLAERKRKKFTSQLVSNKALGERILNSLSEWTQTEAKMAHLEAKYDSHYEAALAKLNEAQIFDDLNIVDEHLTKLKANLSEYETLYRRLSYELSQSFETIRDKLTENLTKQQGMLRERAKHPTPVENEPELSLESRLKAAESILEDLRKTQLQQDQRKAEQKEMWRMSKQALQTQQKQASPLLNRVPFLDSSELSFKPLISKNPTLADTHKLSERLDLSEELGYLVETIEYQPGNDSRSSYTKYFALLGNLARAFEFLKKVELATPLGDHFRSLRNTYFHLSTIPTAENLAQALKAEQKIAHELLDYHRKTHSSVLISTTDATKFLSAEQLSVEGLNKLIVLTIQHLLELQICAQDIPDNIVKNAQFYLMGQIGTLSQQLKLADFHSYSQLVMRHPLIDDCIHKGRKYRHGQNYAAC